MLYNKFKSAMHLVYFTSLMTIIDLDLYIDTFQCHEIITSKIKLLLDLMKD